MKRILLFFILIIFTLNPKQSYGQWVGGINDFTFDLTDTLWEHVIYIDTVSYHHNIWQVGKPQKTIFNSAYSNPNAIVTDTINSYPPNDTSVFILTFPGGGFGGILENVNFYYQLNIDSSTMAKVEFSADTGRTWINLEDSTPICTSPSGGLLTTAGWHFWEMGFNLFPYPTYYMNDSMKFKFTFRSGNDTSGKNGWIIDNFEFLIATEKAQAIQNYFSLLLYPNPTSTSLTITSSNKITSISITSLLGQRVYAHECPPSMSLQVDVSALPSGVYFVKVNGADVRKFLKE